jgi:hypothetical protein
MTEPRFYGQDLRKLKFNMLTVIKKLTKVEANGVSGQWECLCDCGNVRNVRGKHLINGITKSCGCSNFTFGHGNRKSESAKNVSYKSLVRRYKNTSIRRNIEWFLTFEECVILFSENCTYCGVEPNQPYNVYKSKSGKYVTSAKDWADSGDILYNGIDRINSSLPYMSDNVCSCCTTCNFAKNSMSVEDFVKWISKIYSHMQNKGLIK